MISDIINREGGDFVKAGDIQHIAKFVNLNDKDIREGSLICLG